MRRYRLHPRWHEVTDVLDGHPEAHALMVMRREKLALRGEAKEALREAKKLLAELELDVDKLDSSLCELEEALVDFADGSERAERGLGGDLGEARARVLALREKLRETIANGLQAAASATKLSVRPSVPADRLVPGFAVDNTALSHLQGCGVQSVNGVARSMIDRIEKGEKPR